MKPVLSPLSEAFLRFLTAPRDVQMSYLTDRSGTYGYEGRESYGRAEGGLPIVFLVAEDSLARDHISLLLRENEESALQNCLYRLCSLVRLLIEAGDGVFAGMYWDDGQSKNYINGTWELLRHLAAAVLDELGLEAALPQQSYEDVFLAQCYRLPEGPAA